MPFDSERISRKALAEAAAGFHREHEKQFGYASPDDAVQVVSCRVVATGAATQAHAATRAASSGKPVPRETRPVFFEGGAKWVDCPVYWRDDLAPGAALRGPAIVEQLDSTTVIYPDDTAKIDACGNILITVGLEPVEAK